MTVNAPMLSLSGSVDVDEFMALLETRPHGECWELEDHLYEVYAGFTAT